MSELAQEQTDPKLDARFPRHPSGGKPEPGTPFEAPHVRRDMLREWSDHRRDPGSHGVPLDPWINGDPLKNREL